MLPPFYPGSRIAVSSFSYTRNIGFQLASGFHGICALVIFPCLSDTEFFDYLGRGVPYGPDDGTIAPWAVLASLPFAPDIVLPAVDFFIHEAMLKDSSSYGFKASFNPTHPARSGDPGGWWISPRHFGLNQGPIVLMIENYRTGMPWRLMRGCSYIRKGPLQAGFTGGWLAEDDNDPARAAANSNPPGLAKTAEP